MRLTIAIVAALSAFASHGQSPKPQPTPSDFGTQILVEVSGHNGVAQFSLPPAVYEHAQHASLADVRLFNGAGVAIPFTLLDARSTTSTQWRDSQVKIFPVTGESSARQGNLELDVRAAQDGAVLSVRAKQQSGDTSPRLQAIVLDAGTSQETESIHSLQFSLPPNVTSYRAELAVEQSSDLKSWDRVAQSRLDWLIDATQSNRLVNDRIELAAHRGRYLRIRWVDGAPIAFASVAAKWKSTHNSGEDFLEFKFRGTPGRQAGDFIYPASPALLADEIGLDLPNANTVVPANIGYYRQMPSPKRDWQFVSIAQNTFYRLTQDNVERTASRIHIYPQALREWVVRAQAAATSPALVLRLRPKTVIFTAQSGGANPNAYILAFGASDAQLAQWSTSETSLSRVAPGFSEAELEHLELAQLGESLPTTAAIAPKKSEQDGIANAINSRTLILWGVLVFGTLLLAGMTWGAAKKHACVDRKRQ